MVRQRGDDVYGASEEAQSPEYTEHAQTPAARSGTRSVSDKTACHAIIPLTVLICRLQDEKRSWDDLMSRTTAAKSESSAPGSAPPPDVDLSKIDGSLLDPAQCEILNQLFKSTTLGTELGTATQQDAQGSTSPLSTARKRMSRLAQSLEFKVDRLADSSHRMEQYRQTAERVADRIIASAAERLEERDHRAREKSGGGVGGDPIDTLRSLARVMRAKGNGPPPRVDGE